MQAMKPSREIAPSSLEARMNSGRTSWTCDSARVVQACGGA